MFVVIITFKVSLEEVDKHVAHHREYLSEGYKNNYFVASGPQNPRTGGIILSQLKDKALLENIILNDPYYLNEIATYEIIEFNPVKYHPDFVNFIL